jgi:hypothetical protein
MSQDAAGVFLAWPADGTAGFQLQSTRALIAPAWSAVTNGIILTNGSYRLSLPPGSQPTFYRLKE